jgi:hypothetical protein
MSVQPLYMVDIPTLYSLILMFKLGMFERNNLISL